MAATSYHRIQAAAIDGRAQAPRYIQRQLLALHVSLTKALPMLHQIIQQAAGVAASDAWVEISLAVGAVREQYESIDVPAHVRDEYSVAYGTDRPGRRKPYGCVLINPSRHTYLYSVIQPVASAIASGNCVMLYMEQSPPELGRLVRAILTSSLDKDTFAVVDQAPPNGLFLPDTLLISDQTDGSARIAAGSSYIVLNASNSRAVAFVDRTADISQAAKNLVMARFRFGGDSPYAPSIVLVNEFVLREFSQAAIQFLTQLAATAMDSSHNSHSPKLDFEKSDSKGSNRSESTTLVATAVGDVVLLESRNTTIARPLGHRPVLLLHAVKSLDDAIDVANLDDSILIASYQFGDSKAAKYLSQFVNAQSSFTNHIPVELIVGPAAPKQHPRSQAARCATDMYSWPSPEYVTFSALDESLAKLLGMSSSKELNELRSQAQMPLKPMSEKRSTVIGFFEQGLLTGGVLLLATTIAAGTYGVVRYLRG